MNTTSGDALAASPNDGATVSFSGSTHYTFRLSIPAVNVYVDLSGNGSLASLTLSDWPIYPLSYVVYGEWADSKSDPFSVNAFVFGYETPKSAMPTTGKATFSGWAHATVLKSVDNSIHAASIDGKAGLSVDFTSGTITGALTEMKQWGTPFSNGYSGLSWNDVSINASIAGETNRFSGNTAVTSSPNTTFSLAGSAKGHIDGSFYGPGAENLGAIWSLSDGTASALGTVGAAR